MRVARSGSTATTPRSLPHSYRGCTPLLLNPALYSHAAVCLLTFLLVSITTRHLERNPSVQDGGASRGAHLRALHEHAAQLDDALLPEDTSRQPPNPWLTRQTCFHLPDDSEYCTYDGPICSRGLGESLVVLSDVPYGTGLRMGDSRAACVDDRTFEAADDCSITSLGKGRAWAPPPSSLAEATLRGYHLVPSLPTYGLPYSWPASLDRSPPARRWGPTAGVVSTGHVHPSFVANATSAAQLRALGSQWTATAHAMRVAPPPEAAGYTAHFSFAPALVIAPPSAVTWLDGAATFAFLPFDGFSHPWHFAAATFQLWALKRLNASVADSAAFTQQHAPRSASPFYNFSVGATASGGHLPPLDWMVFPSSRSAHHSRDTLPGWTAASLTLLSQPHTRFVFPRELNSSGIGAGHWLCAPRGVTLGQKAGLFSGPGDAHAYRLASYAAANVSTPAWATHAPRTITLVVRERWRRFTNHAEVLQTLRGTGLPVTVVDSLSSMGWEDQVRLFAGTGVLVAAHGAALTNVMHMPVHSAVVEVSPFLGAVPIYRRLAETCRVAHVPVLARYPSNRSIHGSGMEGMEGYAAPEFVDECLKPRWSSGDAFLTLACNRVSKRSQIEVPLDDFQRALAYALDLIGCKDSFCRVPGTNDVRDMRQGMGARPADPGPSKPA